MPGGGIGHGRPQVPLSPESEVRLRHQARRCRPQRRAGRLQHLPPELLRRERRPRPHQVGPARPDRERRHRLRHAHHGLHGQCGQQYAGEIRQALGLLPELPQRERRHALENQRIYRPHGGRENGATDGELDVAFALVLAYLPVGRREVQDRRHVADGKDLPARSERRQGAQARRRLRQSQEPVLLRRRRHRPVQENRLGQQ